MLALLFTDLVDSTSLTERLGDADAATFWSRHHRYARDLLSKHRGREVDSTDGFFLLFDDIVEAARYALEYHETLAGLRVQARAGLHVGPVTLSENSAEDIARGAKGIEVHGLAKPFAARVMALAAGGQTLLSSVARDALSAAVPLGCSLENHGHYRIKGVDQPVEIFELAPNEGTFTPPPDTDKAYRVVRVDGMWHSLREVRHNLPAERDAFVGRGADLRALAARLESGARLVTVVGAGGIGKTRFVRRYALTWLGDWPGGVYFCDLSDARSIEGIHFVVASALEVPLGRNEPTIHLGNCIAGRGHCLVVLDNFEQVLEHASSTVGYWLDRASEATFLVTSRARLHLAGEQVLPLEPLAVERDAIDLFVVRAKAQLPDFALDDGNRSSVTELVRLLDGLPLAIELAAARARVLSPAQLVERMRDRFRVLAGARGAVTRQATLAAAIDWSWDLLAAWEQAAIAQCSVFEGGFTMAAAERVLDLQDWLDAPPAMDVVQALVDKSLLRVRTPVWQEGRFDVDEPYFGMYLSIREYARSKLEGSVKAAAQATRRHGDYFATFGSKEAISNLSRHGGTASRRAFARELDNLVAACRRAMAVNDAQTAVSCYRALWCVVELQGPFALSIALGAQVLTLEGLTAAMAASAGMTYGTTHWRAGNAAEAEAILAWALDLSRSTHAPRLEANLLNSLANVQRETGRMDEAWTNLSLALKASRGTGDRRLEAIVLQNIGVFHGEHGRVQEKRGPCEAALAIFSEVGDRRLEALALANLGMLHLEQGRPEQAESCFETALAINREVGNRRLDGVVLTCLGGVLTDRGNFEDAEELYDRAFVIAHETGDRRTEGVTLGNLGELHAASGATGRSRHYFLQALDIARETGHRRHEGFVLGKLGALSLEEGRLEESRRDIDAALVLHRQVGDTRLEGIVLGSLGDLLSAQGEGSAALEPIRSGEALLHQAGDVLEVAKLLCIRGRVELAIGEKASARRTLADAAEAARSIGAGTSSELGRALSKLTLMLAEGCLHN
jgi:predicted ATPase/class 3 adenylate cyclase/Tfp pilus assembly protein PilF